MPGLTEGRGNRAQTEWLTLGEVRNLLGMNPVTLRHWADSGRIRTFRTVGGHRRFAKEDIDALLATGKGERGRPGPGEIEDAALRRVRRRLHGGGTAPQEWYQWLDEGSRGKLRVMGRRLMELTLEYHTQRRRRPRLLEEARFLGYEYGAEIARSNLSITQMLEAFGFHQESVAVALEQALSPSAPPAEVLGLGREIAHMGNTVLLAMARAYEDARGKKQAGGEGL